MPTIDVSKEVKSRLKFIKTRDGHKSIDSVMRNLLKNAKEYPRAPYYCIRSSYGEFSFFDEQQLKNFQENCFHPEKEKFTSISDERESQFNKCVRCGKTFEHRTTESNSERISKVVPK